MASRQIPLDREELWDQEQDWETLFFTRSRKATLLRLWWFLRKADIPLFLLLTKRLKNILSSSKRKPIYLTYLLREVSADLVFLTCTNSLPKNILRTNRPNLRFPHLRPFSKGPSSQTLPESTTQLSNSSSRSTLKRLPTSRPSTLPQAACF